MRRPSPHLVILTALLAVALHVTPGAAAASPAGSHVHDKPRRALVDTDIIIPSARLAMCANATLLTAVSSSTGFTFTSAYPIAAVGGDDTECPLGAPQTDPQSDAQEGLPTFCTSLFNDATGAVFGVFYRATCPSRRYVGYTDMDTGAVTLAIPLPLYTASAVLDRQERLFSITGSRGARPGTIHSVSDDGTATPVCTVMEATQGGHRLSFVGGELYVAYHRSGSREAGISHLDMDASLANGADASLACVTRPTTVTSSDGSTIHTPLQVVYPQGGGVLFITGDQSPQFGYLIVAADDPDGYPAVLELTPLQATGASGMALLDPPPGFDDGSDSNGGGGSGGGGGGGSGGGGDGTCNNLVPDTFYYLGQVVTTRPTGMPGPVLGGVQYFVLPDSYAYETREDCAGR